MKLSIEVLELLMMIYMATRIRLDVVHRFKRIHFKLKADLPGNQIC